MVQVHSRKILLVQVRFGFIDLKFNCRYSFRPEKKEKLLILLKLDRLSDDISQSEVYFVEKLQYRKSAIQQYSYILIN